MSCARWQLALGFVCISTEVAEVANPEEIDLGDDDVIDDDEGSEPASQNIHAALAAVMQQQQVRHLCVSLPACLASAAINRWHAPCP